VALDHIKFPVFLLFILFLFLGIIRFKIGFLEVALSAIGLSVIFLYGVDILVQFKVSGGDVGLYHLNDFSIGIDLGFGLGWLIEFLEGPVIEVPDRPGVVYILDLLLRGLGWGLLLLLNIFLSLGFGLGLR
jgi:hypothetical protein